MKENSKVSATSEVIETKATLKPTISIGFHRTGSNGDARVHVFADQSTGKKGFWDYIKVMRENGLQKTFSGEEKAYVLDEGLFNLVRPDLEAAGFDVHEAAPATVAARVVDVKKTSMKPAHKLALLGLRSIAEMAADGSLDDKAFKKITKFVAEML